MKNKIIISVVILVVVILVVAWPQIKKNNDEYNKYMCAVSGFRMDCKTPLPENERLK